MSSATSVILALALAADPVTPVTPVTPAASTPAQRVPRAGLFVTASLGIGVIGAGVAFDLYGRTISDPNAPVAAGTAANAEAYFVGGASLIVTGLCMVLISALLTRWYTPKLTFGVPW